MEVQSSVIAKIGLKKKEQPRGLSIFNTKLKLSK